MDSFILRMDMDIYIYIITNAIWDLTNKSRTEWVYIYIYIISKITGNK